MRSVLIIPVYWSSEFLIETTVECLNSLKAFPGPDELLIVDDGSPLRYPNEVPWILERRTNDGYSAAVNAGLDLVANDYDVIIVGNNDLVFLPGWYEALMLPLYGDFDISTIRTTDSDGWETEELVTEGDKFGSLFAMKCEVYESIGGFDNTFKGYFTDMDFKKRAEAAGFRIAKNHAGLVEHAGKATYNETDPDDREFQDGLSVFKKKWGELE